MATSTQNDFRNPVAVAKAVLSAAASVTATVMVVRSVIGPFMPPEFQGFLFSRIRGFLSRFSNEMTMVIEDYDGYGRNELFQAAQVFLAAKQSLSMRRVRVTKSTKENHLTLSMDRNQVLVDTFGRIKLKWVFASRQVDLGNPVHQGRNSTAEHEVQYFELTFHERHREIVFNSYLPFVIEEAKSIKQRKKTLKLYSSNSKGHYSGSLSGAWSAVNLNHPATFETLAMDPELKKMLVDDLDRFVRRKEYYRRVGKAWKRGYLLYGPPGTGKSSLVAAMANYLKFDIYDLELSGLRSNADLQRLLVTTANRSILVVEDIDCTITLQDRRSEARVASKNRMSAPYPQQDELTLSGFLNFIDGLWSSCGDERIIVFTTNHKEKLDPALLLASNYLGIDSHEFFNRIESLLETARVTPAEVAEQLLKSDEPRSLLGTWLPSSLITRAKRMKKPIRRKFISANWLKKMEGVRTRAKTPTSNKFKNPVTVAKAVLSAAASMTTTVTVVQSVVQQFVPPRVPGIPLL
ncbi:hypothetical protein NL676_006313 [Syzygium grande]|nr:hypothetical protein NL676_006313 [Syzygium grande]